ncbi:MAG: 3-oxoacyl-[acyl-carrier protein] reductase [Kiritimatiellia bacterium]
MKESGSNQCVAVVTGAGGGIGRAVSLLLADQKFKVVLAGRTLASLQDVAKTIVGNGGTARVIQTDISDEASIVSLFEQVLANDGFIDVLINNAGVGRFGPLAEAKTEDLDLVLNTNLRGTYLCCREAMRAMGARGSGVIINIASVVAEKGYPLQSAYVASKHGVMGLTKSLAVEAQALGVRVSAILPGGVDTAMVRDARPDLEPESLLAPEDVAGAVDYLLGLSPRAAVDQIVIRRRGSSPF